MMLTLTRFEHKVPPPVWGIIFGAIMFFVAMSVPLISWQAQLRYFISALFIGVGLVIDLYSIFGFIKAKTTINPLSPDASILIVDGLYRYTRNPMYLGLLLILVGWAGYLGALSALSALSALLVLPVFVMTINRLQIAPEERKLQQLFGCQYLDYCRRVRRWL